MALYPAALDAALPSALAADGSGLDPVVPSCLYTEYDGVDDSYFSTDASLRTIASQETWCCEVFMREAPAAYGTIMGGRTSGLITEIQLRGGADGWTIGATAGAKTSGIFTYNQWIKMVAVLNVDRNGSQIYIDGVAGNNSTIGTNHVISGTADEFVLGASDSDGNTAYCDLRNVERYTGIASNPTDWIPGDTNSLTGTTLLMQSIDGSGTDNQQGFTFTKVGDPQIVC